MFSSFCFAGEVRRIPAAEYRDRMMAGWIGQMAGVGQGGPTEFKIKGKIMPESMIPAWQPKMINQFGQDDLYVEMTFLHTLEKHGLDVSIRQAGIDFAASGYQLWHANLAGRNNLRRGIAPPDSGHPQFNRCADDIDYQIEADFSGLIAPGMPNLVIELGEKFGRLMNYGDGLYAGQFVGAMYAEAFFEKDMVRIIQAALKAIPEGSQYAEMVRDVLAWYRQEPDDWQKVWHLIEEKYHKDPAYTHNCCSKPGGVDAFSIDAKLNGAYILLGMLYGRGDPEQTIVISCRAGQDSDCNPSNAAGVLFTTIGFAALPDRYTSALNPKGKFSHTPYDWPRLVEVCEKLARDAVLRSGGRIEKSADGQEIFVIPVRPIKPSALEHVARPGPIANSRFTPEEMKQIEQLNPNALKPPQAQLRSAPPVSANVVEAFAKFAPGWTLASCGNDMQPGLRKPRDNRDAFVTHPLNEKTPAIISRRLEVPAGAKLNLTVGHHPGGDWDLIVRVDGTQILQQTVGPGTSKDGWLEVSVDLSAFAGKLAHIELLNQPTGWSWEGGYWAKLELR
jgi:hypothetical protein